MNTNQKPHLTEVKALDKFVSRKHLSAVFRNKKLKISNINDNATLNKVEEYLKTEANRLISELNTVTDSYLKKIITLPLAEQCFNIKYEELQAEIIPDRLFSSRYLINLIHKHHKKVSGLDPVIKMIEKLLHRKLLHLVEKTSQTCAVSKRVIVVPQLIDLALEMVSNNQA